MLAPVAAITNRQPCLGPGDVLQLPAGYRRLAVKALLGTGDRGSRARVGEQRLPAATVTLQPGAFAVRMEQLARPGPQAQRAWQPWGPSQQFRSAAPNATSRR
jgi:hypothetical protein